MGCCKSKGSCGDRPNLTDEQRKVLEAMASFDGPCAAKDVAAKTGLESKAVSCRIRALKDKGLVESPARCKYQVSEEGMGLL